MSAVLIVACPCALALSAPFAFGTALRVLRGCGLYLKNGFVVEGMARVRHLAFDKTGTLTQGGVGSVHWNGEDLPAGLQGALRGMTESSTHPLSRAISSTIGVDAQRTAGFQEWAGKGIESLFEDQPLRLGSSAWLREKGLELPSKPGSWLAHGDRVLGFFHFTDAPREGLESSLPVLSSRYDVTVLTGDREEGLETLRTWFPGCQDARASLSPGDKLEAIDQLRRDGRAVMMVGDGLNDAGALRHSDVGVAVTEDIQTFTPACDAILEAAHIPDLPRYLRFSRLTVRVVAVSFFISLLYNVVGIAVAASGHLSPLFAAILMPLSSVSVLLISVFGTRLAAKLAGITPGIRTQAASGLPTPLPKEEIAA